MKFIVIENRKNKHTNLCFQSLKASNLDFTVIEETDAGKSYDEFRTHYVHLSTNNIDFELICFRRFFLLANYLYQNPDIEYFILSDSDVIFYPGVDSHLLSLVTDSDVLASCVQKQSDSFRMISPHISYWKRCVLIEFIDFLAESYKSEAKLAELRTCMREFTSRGLRGGVTDMTLLYYFLQSKDNNQKTITKIYKNSTIDHNISVPDNTTINEYDTLFGIKNISFGSGVAYCRRRSDNTKIKFYALHFQGKAKILMPACYKKNRLAFIILAISIGIAKKLKNTVFRYSHNRIN